MSAPRRNPVPRPTKGCLFGAYIEGPNTYGDGYQNAPWDYATWDRFEQEAGKQVALIMFGQPAPWLEPFNYDGAFTAAAARGAVPVVDMMTGTTPLADITAGKHDAALTAWAAAAAAWHAPFVLRLDCEMNGGWYDYGAQARRDPKSFVAMWRHVHQLFDRAGALNVAWHWCPNTDPERSQTPLEELYPGSAYVDWMGFTGYSHATNESLDWVYSATYDRVTKLAPTKPIMIGETASVDESRLAFLDAFFTSLPTRYAKVKAFCWFNWLILENDEVWTWPIASSPASLARFQAGIAAPYFVGRKTTGVEPGGVSS